MNKKTRNRCLLTLVLGILVLAGAVYVAHLKPSSLPAKLLFHVTYPVSPLRGAYLRYYAETFVNTAGSLPRNIEVYLHYRLEITSSAKEEEDISRFLRRLGVIRKWHWTPQSSLEVRRKLIQGYMEQLRCEDFHEAIQVMHGVEQLRRGRNGYKGGFDHPALKFDQNADRTARIELLRMLRPPQELDRS